MRSLMRLLGGLDMTALRMDGTARPAKSASTIARRIVRDWFTQHPINVVSFHWRWAALPTASKEMMALPRTASVHPNRIVFGPSQSEMSLSNIAGCHLTDDEHLQIYFDGQGGVAVEYAPAP